MNPGAQQMRINIHRNDLATSWGFRLQGGADFSTPLSVQLVNPGSLAEQFNLRPGDAVLTINGKPSDELAHEAAKYEILMAQNDLNLLIQRGAVNVWKPKVTPMEDLRPQELNKMPGGEPLIQRTSLAADKIEPMRIGTYNRSAQPFAGFGAPSAPHPQQQYAPPPHQQAPPPHHAAPPPPPQQYGGQQHGGQQQGYGGMEQQNQQMMAGQQGGYGGGYGAPPSYGAQQHSPQPPSNQGYEAPPQAYPGPSPPQQGGAPMPSGIRSVRAPTTKPPGERAPQQQIPVCAQCGGLCVGVFVKIHGEPLHPECFKCMRCGKNLKNQGHFTVEGQRYCDVCAPQVAEAAQPPGSDMSAVPIYR